MSDTGRMSENQKEEIAQEKYGKSYEELGTNEKKAVGGVKGGEARKQQMADEAGGDVHAAYSEMGSKGGRSSNDE